MPSLSCSGIGQVGGGCTPGDDWVSCFRAAKDDEDLRQSQHARCMCTSL